MVDVGRKPVSARRAVAEAYVALAPAARRALVGSGPKGDGLAVARLAGIAAAKRTAELIPLCHQVPLDHVRIDFELTSRGVRVVVETAARATTGVEMEALTAASMAALTVYDMLKAVERGISVEHVRLLRKEGGRSGAWQRPRRRREVQPETS